MQTITTLTINGTRYALTDDHARQQVDAMQDTLIALEEDQQETLSALKQAQQEALAALEQAQQEKTEQMERTFQAALTALQTQQQEKLTQLQHLAEDAAPPVVCSASGKAIFLADAADRTLRGLTLYGRTDESLESAGASGSIGVTVTGKNLIPFPYTDKTVTRTGVTFTVADDGSVTISTGSNGSTSITKFAIAAKNNSQALPIPLPAGLIPGEKYILSGGPFPSGVMIQIYFYKENGDAITNIVLDTAASKSFTIPSNATGWYCCIRVANKTVIQPLRVALMIEKGSQATAWTPYKAQTLSIPTPNGLGDGEEINFAKGVLIHNDGSETTLDAGTLATYAALHTNKPNTGVFNDAGADMSVSYVADTKTYIDRKENG